MRKPILVADRSSRDDQASCLEARAIQAGMLKGMSELFSWTLLAHLLRPQGRNGEVLATLHTDFPENLVDRTGTYLAIPGFHGSPEQAQAVHLTSQWLPTGRNVGRIVLKFAGIDSINAAKRLAGLDLIIPTEERTALEDGVEYIDDLLGCTVYDGGEPLGIIQSIDFSTTPDGSKRLEDVAPLLTVVTSGGDEILIPFVKAFLLSQDTAKRELRMQLPEGLLELNR